MTNKILVLCGDSVSAGLYLNANEYPKTKVLEDMSNYFAKLTSYGHKLAKILNYKLHDLSLPGATNYLIAKQLEYALTLNPTLIIFNTTSPMRLELDSRKIYNVNDININVSVPNLLDFSYKWWNDSTGLNFSDDIKTITDIRVHLLAKHDKKNYESVSNFLMQYPNGRIRKDQSKMFLLSAIAKIEKKNIPYVCCDFNELFDSADDVNLLNFKIKELCRNYPIKNDRYHFNESGHDCVVQKILEKMNLT